MSKAASSSTNVTVEEIREISKHFTLSVFNRAHELYDALFDFDKYRLWGTYYTIAQVYLAGYVDGKRAERAGRLQKGC